MDPIERIEKATALAGEKVAQVKPEDLDKPTPCAEFDVRGLLNHVIGGLDMLKTAADGGKAEAPGQDLIGDGADVGDQYATRRAALLDSIRAEGALDRPWEMPFGSMPGSMMAGIAFMEHLTHAWDVAKATGQDASLPDDVVNECLELVKPMDAMLRMPGVCGPVVEVPEDASPTDKLAGFMGRQP